MLEMINSMAKAKKATQNDEVSRYAVHAATGEEMEDALLFWRTHAAKYPKLSKVAREFLSISCSSVPVESMFSTTGLIMNSRRSSLHPMSLNMISFLHDNLQVV